MSHQLMDSRGEYLENYRCVDRCQKLNTSKKAIKYIDDTSENFMRIDEEFSHWGNRMLISGVIHL